METWQLLEARRSEDEGGDVWHVYNTIWEIVIQGNQSRRSVLGRQLRFRPVRAITLDVELNTGVWEISVEFVN